MRTSKRLLLLLLPLLLLGLGCQKQSSPLESPEPASVIADVVVLFPPGTTLLSATLNIKVQILSGEMVYIHRVVEDWDENTVTWNSFGGAFDPVVENGFLADALGWHQVDVTSLVEGWLEGDYENFGLLMEQPSSSAPRTRYYSREFEGNVPYLEICFLYEGETYCETYLAQQDNFIWELTPDSNYGSLDRLWTGRPTPSDLEKQTLIRWELPALPETASLGDYVWHDLNMDGIQDSTEVGIEGIVVNLYDCVGFIVATTATAADGRYLFEGLTPGDYYVEFVKPAGWSFSPQDQGDDLADSDADLLTGLTICTTLEADEADLSWDAGLFQETVEDCNDCDGKVTELTLRFLAGEAAFIEVFADKDPKPEKLLFADHVAADGQFTFVGIEDDLTMGNEISVWIDGERDTKIHTSCSKPIGPGLVAGEFEVMGGRSRDGGLLCPINDGCGDCDDKVIRLTLRSLLDSAAHVTVYDDKDPKPDKILFDGTVAPDEEFEFSGIKDDGTFNGEISVWVDDDRRLKLKTDCSKPIGPGLVLGGFEIVGGYSRYGGELCPVNDGCSDCDGKVVRLTLQNDGASGLVQVYEGGNQDANKLQFEGFVGTGESFSFDGQKDDGTMGSEISLWVDGVVNTEIHVSCSQPIGPGLSFGDFLVLGGYSRYGGELCPLTPPEEGDCGECKDKVTQLTLRNDGPAALVEIYEGTDPRPDRLLFGEYVMDGVEFTFTGIRDDLTMGTKISVWLGGDFHVEIHTSCSQPIGPDMSFGNFYVVEGWSRSGGLLCPLDIPEDGLCDNGRPAQLTMRYTGESCLASDNGQGSDKFVCDGDPGMAGPVWIVAAAADDPSGNEIYFAGEVALDGSFDIAASAIGRDELKSASFIFVYDMAGNLLQSVEFHTSCSQPLSLGDQFGSLVLEGFIPKL